MHKQRMGVRIGRCDVSVSVPDAEYAAVTQLEVLDTGPEAVKADGVVVLEYTIEPGASTAVTLPEIEIRIEFLLHAVARLMAPRDFNACARVGMSYDESWGTQAVGYEPFAVFAGAAGECRCLVGLACLEHSAQMRAHVYGGPPETVSSGVKGIGAVVVRRNVANLGHFKGREPRTFRDAIYIDTSGVDIYTAVRNYFAWLRGRAYPDDPIVPPGADEVLWHSWYAHQMSITREVISDQARRALELGIRRVQIDAGWDVPRGAAIWGGNRADPVGFPDFSGLIEELHSNGQRVALHMNPFSVDPGMFADQQDLVPLLLHKDGKAFQGSYDARLLCPRCADTRAYILSCVRRMVGEYGVDEVWYDFVDDNPALFGECDAGHAHLPGTPGEHVLGILRAMQSEASRLRPGAVLWGRRAQANPITRQWESQLMPHDRYLDYLGNLRECLFLHQLIHRQLVQFVCTNWPEGEQPDVVARHLITGIFGGVPAISVDLARQSPEILEVIRTYVALYRQHKDWLNKAPRRLLCPEDAVRTIVLDGPACAWVMCANAPPGMLDLPGEVNEVRVFAVACETFAILLPLRGKWTATLQDYRLRDTGPAFLETVADGLLLRARGRPLFAVRLCRDTRDG